MRAVALLALVVVLTSCQHERDRYYYTRADVDAINAEIACRNLARNVLQMERCIVRR